MVAGLIGKVPQLLGAVVGGAVADGAALQALGAVNGLHALAVRYVAELGDPAHLTRHQKQRQRQAEGKQDTPQSQ